MGGVIALLIIPTAIFNVWLNNRYIKKEFAHTLETQARSLAQACELPLSAGDTIELQWLVEKFIHINEHTAFIAIYDVEKNLVVNSIENNLFWEDYRHGNKAKPRDYIVAEGEVTISHSSDSFALGIDYSLSQVEDTPNEQPEKVGFVVIAHSADALQKIWWQHIGGTAGFALFTSFCGLLVVAFTTRRWGQRMASLVEDSERIRQGDLEHPIPVESNDEIGRLAQGFEHMRQAVSERDQKLRKWNSELQKRIDQRTRELQSAKLAAEENAADLEISEARTRSILENAIVGIVVFDQELEIRLFNPEAERIFEYSAQEALGMKVQALLAENYPLKEHLANEPANIEGQANLIIHTQEIIGVAKNGKRVPIQFTVSQVTFRDNVLFTAVLQDMSERNQIELERERLNKQLIETSRLAGMTEMATGVLHNVGNLFNSVNISTRLVLEKLENSRSHSLENVTKLLEEHSEDYTHFLLQDDRGKRLPQYLIQLERMIKDERKQIIEELQNIMKNILLVRDVINVQQTHANVYGVIEEVNLRDLIEEAYRIQRAAFSRLNIDIKYQYEEFIPNILSDHSRILQILINLLTNAKQAMLDNPGERRLKIRLYRSGESNEYVRLEITDNGSGISKENQTKIFSYGFTTKKDGHGFGLHNSALLANDMGGSLFAKSEGEGQGATFIFELPINPSKAEGLSQK